MKLWEEDWVMEVGRIKGAWGYGRLCLWLQMISHDT